MGENYIFAHGWGTHAHINTCFDINTCMVLMNFCLRVYKMSKEEDI